TPTARLDDCTGSEMSPSSKADTPPMTPRSAATRTRSEKWLPSGTTAKWLPSGSILSLAMVLLCSAAQAQIDYRAPREAGRVGEKKIDENNRQKRTAEGKAADAAWERPLTPAQLERSLAKNKAEYDRKASKFSKRYADQ